MFEKLYCLKFFKNFKVLIIVDMLGKFVNVLICVCLNKYLVVVFERVL